MTTHPSLSIERASITPFFALNKVLRPSAFPSIAGRTDFSARLSTPYLEIGYESS
jgi:hypothetical protein